MTQIETPNDELILRYLLNELPDTESQAVEEKFFEDNELFTRLLTLESDLVDDYARGSLSAADRTRFEKGFLVSKERRQMVDNAKALSQYLDERAKPAVSASSDEAATPFWQSIISFFSPQSLTWGYAMAALFAVLTVGVAWLAYDSIRLREQLAASRNQQDQRAKKLQQQIQEAQREKDELQGQIAGQSQQNEELSTHLQSTTERLEQLERELANLRQAQPTVVAAILTPGIDRGGAGPTTVIIRPGTQLLRFQLPLPPEISDSESYSVTLNDSSGRRVLHLTGLRPIKTRSGLALIVRVSSKLLEENTYVFLVRGEDQGEPQPAEPYQFNVVKR